MSVAALLLAATPLFELELRRVEQRVAPAGSLSTAGAARITPLGPRLRVEDGGQARWQLQLGADGALLLDSGRAQRSAPAGQLLQSLPAGRWELLAEPRRQPDGRVRVQLRWSQAEDGGGSQSWDTRLSLRPGQWTVFAREGAPEPAPPPGTLSTRPLAEVRELQLRLSEVLE